MSAHFQSSGPRSNAYSESKFTNWTEYDPYFAECRAALKRFDGRIPEEPAFPHVINLRPQLVDFVHACTRMQVIAKLKQMPPGTIKGLRAVFLLAGTRKQETCWWSKLACYGVYWKSCVFLCAHPFRLPRGYTLDDLRRFYLDDVLVHEIGHHVDPNMTDKKRSEAFAHAFVEEHRRSKG